MCLAVPGRVIDIDTEADPPMATAQFGGVRQRVCVAWVPEARVGDYVIVHVGFAISRLDEEEAMKTLALLGEGETQEVRSRNQHARGERDGDTQ
jgi:hydrogenase expression/formation protein HypC